MWLKKEILMVLYLENLSYSGAKTMFTWANE